MPNHPSASQPDDALLDAGEVAALLGVTRAWIDAASRSGELPTVRLGRYRRSSVLAWVAALEAERRGAGRRT